MKKLTRLVFVTTITTYSLIFVLAFTPSKTTIPVSPEVNYYYGTVITTSPDGKIPYGPTKYSLIKRVVDKTKKAIQENVIQGEDTFEVTLTQLKGTTFKAEDLSKSFSGTITFSGKKPWKWDKWIYDIKMTQDGGKITGIGKITGAGLETEKFYSDSTGVKRAKIIETFVNVSENKYNELKNAQNTN